jgi:hypothetical protein
LEHSARALTCAPNVTAGAGRWGRVLSPLASGLKLTSVGLCLIVGVSFLLFAINQSSSASAHQQQALGAAEAGRSEPIKSSPASGAPSKGSLRESIENVSKAITSPFDAVTEEMSSQWTIRVVDLLLALVVYGFGLGFIARAIRVRL